MQGHPPWNSVLHYMRLSHTRKFLNAVAVSRDNRLCNA